MPTVSRQKTSVQILQAEHLKRIPWLIHGFSTRLGGFSRAYGKGDLNLGFTKDEPEATVKRNRAAFLQKLGAVNRSHNGKSLWPVDTKKRAVAAVHAGWRGTVQRIVEKADGPKIRCFDSRVRDLKAAIGPGIHRCCYEVGEEVRTQFESQFGYWDRLFREVKESDPVREKYPLLFLTARAPGHGELPPKIFLDLVEANRQQLLAAGVPGKSIETSPLCTNCHPELLFSYRAEKGETGRLMGVAGIRV